MSALFRALTDRLKALFLTEVGLDFEAELLTRDAERRAELLRQAQRYEEEGLHGLAEHLRRRAEALSLDRPLASVLPAVAHLQTTQPDPSDTPLLPAEADGVPPDNARPRRLPEPPGIKKKGR